MEVVCCGISCRFAFIFSLPTYIIICHIHSCKPPLNITFSKHLSYTRARQSTLAIKINILDTCVVYMVLSTTVDTCISPYSILIYVPGYLKTKYYIRNTTLHFPVFGKYETWTVFKYLYPKQRRSHQLSINKCNSLFDAPLWNPSKYHVSLNTGKKTSMDTWSNESKTWDVNLVSSYLNNLPQLFYLRCIPSLSHLNCSSKCGRFNFQRLSIGSIHRSINF